MSFNKAPSNWITGYSSDGTSITIPIASLPGLTTGNAHTTTGDIREVMYRLNEAFKTKWLATAAADRPTQFSLSASATVNSDTGVISERYNYAVQAMPTGLAVVSET